jgi:hypothetical protein
MSTALLSHSAAAPSQLGQTSAALLEALHDALASERRLLEDLIAQMRRQRSAVGVDDIQGIDDSTFATHRILATLGQARQRRRQLNLLLCGIEECTLSELESMLGDMVDARLREARLRLQQAADLLAREVGMNRKLLREAIANGEQHVRTLAGMPATPTYAAEGSAAPAASAPRGVIVNRTA